MSICEPETAVNEERYKHAAQSQHAVNVVAGCVANTINSSSKVTQVIPPHI